MTAEEDADPEELRQLEEQYMALQQELEQLRSEVQEARLAGNAVLTAAEAVMAPLMAELAGAQRTCVENGQLAQASASEVALASSDGGGDALPLDASPEAEVQHLRVELQCCQERVERLEVEQSRRLHDAKRMQSELAEVAEALSYEKRRARHYEACKLANDSGEPRNGPKAIKGLGLRTMEARGEQELRECAEQRTGKLAREVVRLAGNLAEQQALVEKLTKELGKARQRGQSKDRQLEKAAKQTQTLRTKLAHGPEASPDFDEAPGGGRPARRRRPRGTQSTGKLPQLSF